MCQIINSRFLVICLFETKISVTVVWRIANLLLILDFQLCSGSPIYFFLIFFPCSSPSSPSSTFPSSSSRSSSSPHPHPLILIGSSFHPHLLILIPSSSSPFSLSPSSSSPFHRKLWKRDKRRFISHNGNEAREFSKEPKWERRWRQCWLMQWLLHKQTFLYAMSMTGIVSVCRCRLISYTDWNWHNRNTNKVPEGDVIVLKFFHDIFYSFILFLNSTNHKNVF